MYPMTPLQSWAMMLLLAIGVILFVRILMASPDEWRELFSRKSTDNDQESLHE